MKVLVQVWIQFLFKKCFTNAGDFWSYLKKIFLDNILFRLFFNNYFTTQPTMLMHFMLMVQCGKHHDNL